MGSDEPVSAIRRCASLEERVRELERLLGRKTWRSCVRRWLRHRQKTDLAAAVAAEERFPMKRVAEALGVSRSTWSSGQRA